MSSGERHFRLSSSTMATTTARPSAVIPGEVISLGADVLLEAGPGTSQLNDNSVRATKAGILSTSSNRSKGTKTVVVSVQSIERRYTPIVNDQVVGVVTSKQSDHYRVDIGASREAYLPALAFQGATKRNRPNINVGAVIFGQVEMANPDMRPQLTCISAHFKKEWTTGEALFGELQGGYIFSCSTALVRQLLDDNCAVLKALGEVLPFEITVGANGKVWVRADTIAHTIIAINCIANSEHLPDETTVAMVRELLNISRNI